MAGSKQFIAGSIIPLATFFQDQLGNYIEVDGSVVTIVGPGNQTFVVNQIMNRDPQGTYSYLWQTAANLPVGHYQELYEGFYKGQIIKNKSQFEIVAADAFNRPEGPTTRTGKALELLRDALADNLPNVKRKQWHDKELLNFLNLALQDVNGTPAVSGFSIDNYPDHWTGVIMEGAIALALRALIIEMAMFDIDFSDEGKSVSIRNVIDHYMQLYNDAAQRFEQKRTLLKKNYRPMGMNILSGQVAGFNIRSLRFSQLLSIVNQR